MLIKEFDQNWLCWIFTAEPALIYSHSVVTILGALSNLAFVDKDLFIVAFSVQSPKGFTFSEAKEGRTNVQITGTKIEF